MTEQEEQVLEEVEFPSEEEEEDVESVQREGWSFRMEETIEGSDYGISARYLEGHTYHVSEGCNPKLVAAAEQWITEGRCERLENGGRPVSSGGLQPSQPGPRSSRPNTSEG